MQIQQGKLLLNGTIDKTTLEWKKLNEPDPSKSHDQIVMINKTSLLLNSIKVDSPRPVVIG